MNKTFSWGNLHDWQFERESGGNMTIWLKSMPEFIVCIRITPDLDTNITDYDCYSEEQVRAWRNNEWGFVVLEISFKISGERVGSTEYVGGVDDLRSWDGDKYIAQCALDYLEFASVCEQLASKLRIVEELSARLDRLEGKVTE